MVAILDLSCPTYFSDNFFFGQPSDTKFFVDKLHTHEQLLKLEKKLEHSSSNVRDNLTLGHFSVNEANFKHWAVKFIIFVPILANGYFQFIVCVSKVEKYRDLDRYFELKVLA